MTSYHNDEQRDYSAVARTARRCIRAYMDVLHKGLYSDSVLAALSTSELTVLREMMLEMYDDYPGWRLATPCCLSTTRSSGEKSSWAQGSESVKAR
jgi:hypothetical protein